MSRDWDEMTPCTCSDRPRPDRKLWEDFIATKSQQHLQRCRDLLNEHYHTDYFSNNVVDAVHKCPCKLRPKDRKEEQEMKRVRILVPPYWALVPVGRKRVSNPYEFTRRFGEGPNPRPWLSELERPQAMCINRKANVGRQVDPVPLHLVSHTLAWDPETELEDSVTCNLWHCKLLHKKSKADRPW